MEERKPGAGKYASENMEITLEDEAEFRWKNYGLEDGLVLIVFWILGLIVFAQFFSRYVLNSPLGWTEEVARYLLICVGFLGATIGVRKNTHIFLEFFHRYLSSRLLRLVVIFIDIVRIVFFGTLMLLAVRIMPIMHNQRMTAIPVPVSYLYAAILFSFVVMTLHSALIFRRHAGEARNGIRGEGRGF